MPQSSLPQKFARSFFSRKGFDGGYTVFGRVVSGMEVVDRIARGDRIRTVRITEDGRLSSDNRRTAARVANTLRR